MGWAACFKTNAPATATLKGAWFIPQYKLMINIIHGCFYGFLGSFNQVPAAQQMMLAGIASEKDINWEHVFVSLLLLDQKQLCLGKLDQARRKGFLDHTGSYEEKTSVVVQLHVSTQQEQTTSVWRISSTGDWTESRKKTKGITIQEDTRREKDIETNTYW